MTRDEIRNSHPSAYQEIVNEGVNSERERVASWMVYANADIEAVTEGIESGANISASQREKLMVKMNSIGLLQSLQQNSAKPFVTNETQTENPKEKNDEGESEELKNAFAFEL